MPPALRGALLVLLVSAAPARAQLVDGVRFEMSNLLEFQSGRDFVTEEEDRSRFFDQFILDVYPSDAVRLGLRFETYQDSPPPELFGFAVAEYEYAYVAQRFAEWSNSSVTARVGNFYAIFGHGLVLRAFELPGVVRQTLFPIVGYAESRDIDGAFASANYGRVDVTVLHGKPVIDPEVPPEQEMRERRGGSVSGASASVRVVEGLTVGGSVLRADGLRQAIDTSHPEESGAVELFFDPVTLLEPVTTLPFSLSTSIEYAGRSWQPFVDGITTSGRDPHALYTNTQLGWSTGAVSVETKDYRDFRSPVNDPPTLVPEFSHRLLNRTTHVLDPLDEKGHQVSLGQALPDWLGGGSIELIHAGSKGRRQVLGQFVDPRVYQQAFVSVESSSRYPVWLQLYFSDGKDEFEDLSRLRTFGGLVSVSMGRDWATEVDIAHQVRDRDLFGNPETSEDYAVVASVSRAGLGQIGVLYEHTNDPFFLDDPFTPEIETDPRNYLGGSVSWRAGPDHDVIVFYGKRRGGTACTSGTCYYVPDFEGMELRVLSRF